MFRIAALALLAVAACKSSDEAAKTSGAPARPAIDGKWQASLESPGGELGFVLELDGDKGRIFNGDEVLDIAEVTRTGDDIAIAIAHYDASIRARLTEGKLVGEWKKTTPKGHSRLPFSARPFAGKRFSTPLPEAGVADIDISGSWKVTFSDDDGEFGAVGLFRVDGGKASGTFMTATGDYRYLAGDYGGGFLRLSAFDGAHAFLFHAKTTTDKSLTGQFWSRDVYHAVWTADRIAEAAVAAALPDPFAEVKVTRDDGVFQFSFPSAVDGKTISNNDEQFRGKVVLVDLFGTWCPNCNDASPILAGWHRKYRDRGLAVVGLAFEFTGDAKRDAEMVVRHRDKYNIEYPLLLAGVSKKSEATKALPSLTAVKSYPTTIFVGRDGKVRRIHSGFAGPATGAYHKAMVAEMEAIIETLLTEQL